MYSYACRPGAGCGRGAGPGVLAAAAALLLLSGPMAGSAYAETVPVSVGGASHDIRYEGNGVSITRTDVDEAFASVILYLDVSPEGGTLVITLPRDVIDSVYQGDDDEFIVIADDGDEPSFEETVTTPDRRILRVDLDAGTEELEIVGSLLGGMPDGGGSGKEDTGAPPAPGGGQDPADGDVDPRAPGAGGAPAGEREREDGAGGDADAPITCGAGTILRDGVCVPACGAGLVLQDGVCVPRPEPASAGAQVLPAPGSSSSPVPSPAMGKELVIGAGAGLGASLVVMTVLWLIGRAGRSRD